MTVTTDNCRQGMIDAHLGKLQFVLDMPYEFIEDLFNFIRNMEKNGLKLMDGMVITAGPGRIMIRKIDRKFRIILADSKDRWPEESDESPYTNQYESPYMDYSIFLKMLKKDISIISENGIDFVNIMDVYSTPLDTYYMQYIEGRSIRDIVAELKVLQGPIKDPVAKELLHYLLRQKDMFSEPQNGKVEFFGISVDESVPFDLLVEISSSLDDGYALNYFSTINETDTIGFVELAPFDYYLYMVTDEVHLYPIGTGPEVGEQLYSDILENILKYEWDIKGFDEFKQQFEQPFEQPYGN